MNRLRRSRRTGAAKSPARRRPAPRRFRTAIPRCRRKKFPAWSMRAANSATRPAAPACAISCAADLREQLRREIHAQFEKFRATGLPLDHVNGHLHLHLHPDRFPHPDGGRRTIRHPAHAPDARSVLAERAAGVRASWLYRATPRVRFISACPARARPALRRRGHPPHATAFSACCKTRAWMKPTFCRLLPQLAAGRFGALLASVARRI